jgi:serine/threonine-protein kinase RsbW
VTTNEARIVLSSSPAEVSELQAKLSALCGEAGLDELAGFQLTCAIVEAVNNCIEHAYAGEVGKPISVSWMPNPEAIVVEIRDRGQPMPSLPPETAATPDVAAESGRGWHIIREWTDTADYIRETDENVLTLTRRR